MRKDQDLRVKHTLQFIDNALLSLISEKGFDTITISELTNRAGINKSTFYKHYSDKLQLLERITDKMLKQLIVDVNKVSKPYSKVLEEMVCQFLIVLINHIQENANFYKVMLGDKMANDFSSRMQSVLQKIFYAGLASIHPDNKQSFIKRDIYIDFMSAAFMGVISRWLKNGMVYSPHFLADQITKINNNGAKIWELPDTFFK